MKASNVLKKYIIVEIIALLFLLFSIIYCIFVLNRNANSDIKTKDGLVLVLDDSKHPTLEAKSDGEGLSGEGTTYAITNNNTTSKKYQILIIPVKEDEKTLSNIRVSIDNSYIYDLTELDKIGDGYVLRTFELKPGYTKNHVIKVWYRYDTNESNIKDIKFKYDIEIIK